MKDPKVDTCDDHLLNRYLDKELDAADKARLKAHLDHCRQCRYQLAGMIAMTKDLRDQVRRVCDAVDFRSLEKRVINKALRRDHTQGAFSAFTASLKYTIPATVAAGMLLFWAYSSFLANPAPLPSAIINSFTGPVSSVMIFQTPKTRQTILWYNEDPKVENEQDAG